MPIDSITWRIVIVLGGSLVMPENFLLLLNGPGLVFSVCSTWPTILGPSWRSDNSLAIIALIFNLGH
jgi:hypothetical protein